MHKELKQYPLDFAILFASFIVVLVFFWHLRHILAAERTLLLGLVSFYLLWGLAHHLYHHDLTAKIMVEYLSFALLALAMGLVLFQAV